MFTNARPRNWLRVSFLICLAVIVASCSQQASPIPRQALTAPANARQIPPKESFTIQAEGTLLPPGTSYAQTLNLPAGSSGALFINKIGSTVNVVLSNTIATIPIGQIYLFVLPPGEHEFYIYGLTDQPLTRIERTEAEKVQYIYLVPLGASKSGG